MHPKFNATLNQVMAWAHENPVIQGVVVIGSQARSTLPADEWSDLDLMVLVDAQQQLVAENTWFHRFGDVVCYFDEIVPLHFTNWNWCVKRVLYADNSDIDFSILPFPQLDEVLMVNKDILAKGYRVIYDSSAGRLDAQICALLQTGEKAPAQQPSEPELRAVANDLLFHVIWAFKKIKRGELWVAQGCINGYMRDLLVRLIEAHNHAFNSSPNHLAYSGRFLEQRTDPAILAKLKGCFTRYDRAEAVEALQHLLEIGETLWKSICQKNGYAYDAGPFERVQGLYSAMRAEEMERHAA